eukprot:362318-Chlamydomonas_euryale.AAC.2
MQQWLMHRGVPPRNRYSLQGDCDPLRRRFLGLLRCAPPSRLLPVHPRSFALRTPVWAAACTRQAALETALHDAS